MVIDEFIIEGIIKDNMLSLEYDVQQALEREILTEASASSSFKQKEALKELFDRARAYLKVDGSTISVELTFLSVPNGMEDYAEMLKSNTGMTVQTILKEKLKDVMSLDQSVETIREYIYGWAVENLRNLFGGT